MKRMYVAIVALGAIAALGGVGSASAQSAAGGTHTNRILNMTLRVADLDRALKFYVDGLGMHERGRRQVSKDVTELTIGYSKDSSVAELMLVNSNAPAGGVSVTLATSNASAAQVPPVVMVPAGQSQAAFSVTTFAVTAKG